MKSSLETALAERILVSLSRKFRLSERSRKELNTKFAEGLMKEQDWILLIENELLEKGREDAQTN